MLKTIINKCISLIRILFAFLLVCTFLIESSFATTTYNKVDESGFKLFKSVLDTIKNEYIEELSIKQILSYAVQGMMTCLDPHSAYLDPKEYAEMKAVTSGEFGGLGLEITMEHGVIKVVSPYDDAPAFKAGVKAGDYIIAIDGKSTKGMSLKEAGEKLKGESNTSINIRVYREKVGVIEISMNREIIKIVPVKSKILSDGAVGYIKISMFNDKASKLAKHEWLLLKKKNPLMLGLILDLRSNPGGVLQQAKEVADLFLAEGDIVTIKARKSSENQSFRANSEDITNGIPIVVLINSGSASAAEIVAGALQDNGRALILGTKSFGKGSVQKIIPLIDKSAIKLTTALYYTPSGKSIQANGIVPDIIVPEIMVKATTVKNFNPVSESSLVGHIESNNDVAKDMELFDSESSYLTLFNSTEEIQDFQLIRAIDVVKTMSLYAKKYIPY